MGSSGRVVVHLSLVLRRTLHRVVHTPARRIVRWRRRARVRHGVARHALEDILAEISILATLHRSLHFLVLESAKHSMRSRTAVDVVEHVLDCAVRIIFRSLRRPRALVRVKLSHALLAAQLAARAVLKQLAAQRDVPAKLLHEPGHARHLDVRHRGLAPVPRFELRRPRLELLVHVSVRAQHAPHLARHHGTIFLVPLSFLKSFLGRLHSLVAWLVRQARLALLDDGVRKLLA
mmetsp:Transcript_11645/g.29413  ORF Transcript_11645/g.29413 Transcript_11645/m.29413 type:complete len:234 (-) Transcript_11645:1265-1966(-)